MKTFFLTALMTTFIASAGAAQAAQFVSDPLLQDLAQSGQVINPHGFSAGR